MAFEIEQPISMIFNKGRLFLCREDLVQALEESAAAFAAHGAAGDAVAAATITDIANGLKEITIGG
jgi:hypothetical protein